MADKTPRDDAQPAGTDPKKPYAPPTVTEYGSVAKLTLVKGMTDVEGNQPASKRCL